MATELAKAYVQIIPSAEGIQGRIQKEIEPEADSAGSSFGGKMVGMIKKVIATAAIGKALSASISEGAALEQSLGGIETLFKDSADKVKAKKQLNDNRDYIYDMDAKAQDIDIQSAEAYVNSEYAVALAELEV